MGPGDLPQPAPQLVFLPRTGTAPKALGRPVLTDDPTGTAFGDPEAIDEHDHRPPLALRGQKFPSANSLSIDLSSSASASSFFSRAFSVSSWRSRFASSAFIPPY
jgi:hypothetical protein